MSEQNKLENNKEKKQADPKKGRNNLYWLYGLIIFALLGIQFINFMNGPESISQNEFLNNKIPMSDIEKIELLTTKNKVKVFLKRSAINNTENEAYAEFRKNNIGSYNSNGHYTFDVGSVDSFDRKFDEFKKSNKAAKNIKVEYPTGTSFLDYFYMALPLLIIIGLWIYIMRRVSGGMGGGGSQIFNIGKSKAKLFDEGEKVNVTFKDVAGLDEAKVEVMEIVDFLKTPEKYTALGGKIPKGALLIGPPGTGKTLLAKAMAGEAKVPFFSISGSDFVEMFVGVGASRVRDLFKQAREKAPCIIFIDEIDAIGRARGRNTIQGNDERENTLNALLVEMDGFASDKGVIIIAATNRPDVLDSALLRPGRFDRQIGIDKPDLSGREQIFRVHLKPLTVANEVIAEKLAQQTPGFAGAEIANICNEAALIAARRNKKAIEMKDFQDAIDRVIGGLEKKNKIISPEEKEIIAYHEAGHAVAGWYLEHAHPLVKVTIVPRGVAALGYAQYLPKEQYLYRTEQLMDEMCMTLGGRAAEEIVFGKITTGAQNDLEKVTRLAYAMTTIYGMNNKVGQVSFHDSNGEYQFNKPYSEETATLIDDEVRNLINKAYDRTKKLLTKYRDQLNLIAKQLLDKEILLKDDLVELIGERMFPKPAVVLSNNNGTTNPQIQPSSSATENN